MVITFFHTLVHSNLPNLHNLHLFIHHYTLIHTSLHIKPGPPYKTVQHFNTLHIKLPSTLHIKLHNTM